MTDTELNVMAELAMMGLSSRDGQELLHVDREGRLRGRSVRRQPTSDLTLVLRRRSRDALPFRVMNPSVDWFFEKDTPWKDAYAELRSILLDCGLSEELRWGCPCYTADKRNIVLIHGFKDYCAGLFFKGALLTDPKGLLVRQTANVQSARQMRFTRVQEIVKARRVIKAYVMEAVAVERAGLKVQMKATSQFKMPEEFAAALKSSPPLQRAFRALTPGRQRGYLLHFDSAKRSLTREARIERNVARIMAGKGLDD